MTPPESVFHRTKGDNLQLCLALDDMLMTSGRTWVRGLSHLLVIAFYGVCARVCVCTRACTHASWRKEMKGVEGGKECRA